MNFPDRHALIAHADFVEGSCSQTRDDYPLATLVMIVVASTMITIMIVVAVMVTMVFTHWAFFVADPNGLIVELVGVLSAILGD